MRNHAARGIFLRLLSVNWPSPARWALWSTARPRWIVFALTGTACTVGVTVTSLAGEIGNLQDLTWFAILLAMGLTQAEMWREIERMRRRLGGHTHINVTSVWFLAGIVLLSPGWVALLAAALFAHLWARVWRHISTRPTHRVVASTMLAMLSCWAAAETLHVTGLGDLTNAPPGTVHAAAVVLTGAAVFELVNLLLAAAGVCLYTRQRSLTDLVGTRSDNALEVVTLCLGGLTAAALAYQPVLSLLTFPPLLLLHRQVLLKQLSITVATDEKTGLFTNSSWHHLANREFDRVRHSSGALAIFMVDIDHFKKVNDTHGHLVGDTVLKAVATAVSLSVRDYDSVGRFGGEEFVVLLPHIAVEDVGVVAERVRHAVTQLTIPVGDDNLTTIDGMSVSIGTAHRPSASTTLNYLIHTADDALLHAKRTGRNRVSHA